MRKLLFTGVALLSMLAFVACEKEEVDNEKPVILLHAPTDGEAIKPGSDIHFDVEFSDNVALSSYKVNIHGAFDGHTHGVANPSLRATDEGEEFERTWFEAEFIEMGEEPIAGKRSVTIHHHRMVIPETISRTVNGQTVEMPLKEGHYHFMVYCTDEAGLESFVAKEITISYDAEDHDHDHDH